MATAESAYGFFSQMSDNAILFQLNAGYADVKSMSRNPRQMPTGKQRVCRTADGKSADHDIWSDRSEMRHGSWGWESRFWLDASQNSQNECVKFTLCMTLRQA